MTHDIPDVNDHGAATIAAERQLRGALKRRDGSMAIIEASRNGPSLPTDEYVGWKTIHGNAERDVHRFAQRLDRYGDFYRIEAMDQWQREQDEAAPRSYSLTTVWDRWRAVLAARRVYLAIADEVVTDRWGGNPIEIVSRRKIDALVAVCRAEGAYDLALRAFEGREPRRWDQTINGFRVHAPTRPERAKRLNKRQLATRYIRDACGNLTPRRKS